MSDDLEPEKPWTEEQWLAEFRRSDARSARFGELLETLMDHPDRDAIISREMGWDREEDREPIEGPPFEDEDDAFETDVNLEADDDPQSERDETASFPTDLLHDEDADDRAEGLPLLSEVPAYRAAVELAEFTIGLNRALGDSSFADVHHEERFGELYSNLLIPAAKMRGGHSFGYDDQICANIVCNRFALEAAETAERALVELHAAGVLPAYYAEQVLPRVCELIGLLNERIAEMRTRVWW